VQITALANRLYTLERSMNLSSWMEITPPAPGAGGSLTLTDTNAPAGQAFYRVGCRRP
jgi:hypothetical protein